MKKLNLLDQSPSFKVNDTGTIIPFNAFEDNQPFSVTADDATPVFRIKNEMGFLKSVNATVAVGGYIFQLNTKDLVGLVPGTYQVELAVTAKTNEELIFPDTGFCSFNITDSTMTVTGTQIPSMSLDSFKNELQQYVENQATSKLQTIESDFQTYVNNLQNSTIKQSQQASSDAQNAIKTANGAVTTANNSLSTANAASSLASAASSMANQALGLINSKLNLEDYAKKNNLTDLNNLPIGMYQTNGGGTDSKLENYPPIEDFGTIWVLQRWINDDKQQIAIYPNKIFTRFQSPDTHNWSSWIAVGGVNNLIENSDFSQGLMCGYTNNNATITLDGMRDGINIAKIVVSGQSSTKYYGLYSTQRIKVNPGDVINASLWYKATGLDNNAKFEINILNATGNRLSNGGALLTNQSDWTEATYTFTAPANAAYIKINYFVYSNGTLWINKPQLSLGFASDYAPSITALGTQLGEIQQQIAALTQQIATLQKNS